MATPHSGRFSRGARRGRCADARPGHRCLRLRRRGARPRASSARATSCAASPARPSGWRRRASCSATSCAATPDRRRPGQALDGDRRRLLPDPLDGGRGRRRVPRAGAARRRAFAEPPPPRGVRRVVYLGGLVPAEGAALAPPRLSPGRRGGAAGRHAGVDRAARLDRDRRAFALVPLPRAADRAAARARAARLARQPHPADRRPRRARLPDRRRHRARGGRRPLVGHRRPGHPHLRAADREDRRPDARRPPPSWAWASRSRRSPRRSPRPSRARIRR